MDDIAAAAKRTERAFYHQISGNDQLLGEVQATRYQLDLETFGTFGDSLAGSAQAIVQAIFRDIAGWANSRNPPDQGSLGS